MLLDALLGDPRRLPHPVVLIGRLISVEEKLLYKKDEKGAETKKRGLIFCLLVLATTGFAVTLLLKAAAFVSPAAEWVLSIYLLYAALAYRSLKDESRPVANALAAGDLEAARRLVGRIVGRDTWALGREGVTRATVETIAESYIDGVFSVLFYMTLGWFFGIAPLCAWLFKAASTMDSMVGYDDERYHDFGWAAAKLDDLLNFLPARLGSVVAICAGALAGFDWRRATRVFRRDRLKHKSPNSAHAESVFAGLLGIRLAGGAYYGGEWEGRPTLGDDLREPEPDDIMKAHHILDLCMVICAIAVYLLTARNL